MVLKIKKNVLFFQFIFFCYLITNHVMYIFWNRQSKKLLKHKSISCDYYQVSNITWAKVRFNCIWSGTVRTNVGVCFFWSVKFGCCERFPCNAMRATSQVRKLHWVPLFNEQIGARSNRTFKNAVNDFNAKKSTYCKQVLVVTGTQCMPN